MPLIELTGEVERLKNQLAAFALSKTAQDRGARSAPTFTNNLCKRQPIDFSGRQCSKECSDRSPAQRVFSETLYNPHADIASSAQGHGYRWIGTPIATIPLFAIPASSIFDLARLGRRAERRGRHTHPRRRAFLKACATERKIKNVLT
jgi:hypothetical protein